MLDLMISLIENIKRSYDRCKSKTEAATGGAL